jgi:predicted RNA-binding Zn-ribbon protein involved in translation (DUF1610 family)
MENTKTCPKCGTEMKAAGYEMVLPAMNDSRVAVSARPISDSAGMSVSPFYCPNCAFVELWGQPNYERIVRGKRVAHFCSE